MFLVVFEKKKNILLPDLLILDDFLEILRGRGVGFGRVCQTEILRRYERYCLMIGIRNKSGVGCFGMVRGGGSKYGSCP